METKFNFKSQICTNKNQSERLLALGLKKETADMFYDYCKDRIGYTWYLVPKSAILGDKRSIPAWSLGRLMEITLNETWNEVAFERDVNPYEQMIKGIEWLIKEGYFPKEYLV